MKINNFKKKYKEFDPITHWYSLLLLIIFIFILIISYSLYMYFYIKNEISLIKSGSQSNSGESALVDSPENNKLFKNINDLNRNIDKFNIREIEYRAIVDNAKPAQIITVSTTTTTVATSTKQ